MGFRLIPIGGAGIHEGLQLRGTHKVAVSGNLCVLLNSCEEARTHAEVAADGTAWIPYWLALLLSLQLVGPEAAAEWKRPLWAWIFDPAVLGRPLSLVISSQHFDADRNYTLAALVAALRVARDEFVKSLNDADPMCEAFKLSFADMLHAGIMGPVESFEQADVRLARDGEACADSVMPIVARGFQFDHWVDAAGTFRPLAFVETVLFPRFTLRERSMPSAGFRVAVTALARSAFEQFVDEAGVPNVDWLQDEEAASEMARAFKARMPPILLSVAPPSGVLARVLLFKLMEAEPPPTLLQLSAENVRSVILALPAR